MWKLTVAALLLAVSTIGCRKKPDPVVTPPNDDGKGAMSITFQNIAGTQPLMLGSAWYMNANGDSFQVNTYKYYVSNVVLVRADGTEFTEFESYHLIDEANNQSKSFQLNHVPEGNYVKMKFLLGVDSARNVSGAQTGALDPMHGMFWDWQTGYIMAKLEGNSPQANTNDKSIIFHTGGFGGNLNVLREVTLEFPQFAVIETGKKPNGHIKADILEWFQDPSVIDFKQTSVVMGGKDLKVLADNYADMFTVDHID